MDDNDDLLETLKTLGPFGEVKVEAFLAMWERQSPRQEVQSHCCSRCGSLAIDWETHYAWHRKVSLGMYLLTDFVHGHLTVHEQLKTVFAELVGLFEGEEGK